MRNFAIIMLMGLSGLAVSDSWRFKPELSTTEFEFGDTRVVRTVDAREDQMYPDFRIDVHTEGELVGRYPGHSFDRIVASGDNKLFLGISNSGLPRTALIFFDSKGRIRLLLDHLAHSDMFEYCEQSVTLTRKWYDREDPQLEFTSYEGQVEAGVKSCGTGIVYLSDFY